MKLGTSSHRVETRTAACVTSSFPGLYPMAACSEFHISCGLGSELFALLICCYQCPWSHGSCLKILVWRCHQLLPRFLARGHLPRHLVANDKSNNEMIPGAVYRYPDIYLTTEENPGKPQLGDHLMKAVHRVI